MVRVLSCHHFRAQKVGQCEGGVGVTLAGEVVIIAMEHLISVYAWDNITDVADWFTRRRVQTSHAKGQLGGRIQFKSTSSSTSSPTEEQLLRQQAPDSPSDTLQLSHSFPPVDLIHSIAYNERGHFLQCLERREGGMNSFRVRIYFHWEHHSNGKPMKARIAGLVSPTGGDFDSDSLLMIEIPPEPLFAIVATTSCQYLGNVATLSNDARVNVYAYGLKEGTGRRKLPYADFDLVLTLQFESPSASVLAFELNHIGILSSQTVSVVKLKAKETTPQLNREKPKPGYPTEKGRGTPDRELIHEAATMLLFNSKNSSDSVLTVPIIAKENRKNRQSSGYEEEFGDEIQDRRSHSLPLTKSAKGCLIRVKDVLRVTRNLRHVSSSALIHLSLHAQRLSSLVGGTLCFVATQTDVLVYHLPEVDGESKCVRRVTRCPFTGLLQHLRFDSAFIHALTETGIETYSSRGLAEALRDVEGFTPLNNDCPLMDESPCLLGIRPFPGVRFMECNSNYVCLLSAPENQASQTELWTIYLLESPPVEQFYEDTMRAAAAHKESSPETYFTLLSEIHLFLRKVINSHPEENQLLKEKYRHVTRQMGFLCFRKWMSDESDDLYLNRGIAFLQISHTDAKFIFKKENQDIPKDPQLVVGISKFLRLTVPMCGADDFPPSVAKAIVEFLIVNSMPDLAEVALETPWLREAQGERILTALRGCGEIGWKRDLALILVIVSVHGIGIGTDEILDVLKRTDNFHRLEKHIKTSWILKQSEGRPRALLTELAVTFALTRTKMHTNVIKLALDRGEVSLEDVIVAFRLGTTRNSDFTVQEVLTRDIRTVLENYFFSRKDIPIVRDELVMGLKALVTSYLDHISDNQRNLTTRAKMIQDEKEGWFSFGKLPGYLRSLIDDSVTSNTKAKSDLSSLATLVMSPLGSVAGVKEQVLLASKKENNPRIKLSLRVIAEAPEKVLDLLFQEKPELILIYAKETFGVSAEAWKSLVMKLKHKIASHPRNQEFFVTLAESVYLHLVNNMSPPVLEEILEKEANKDQFLDAATRVTRANAFADKIVEVSTDFLSKY